MVVAEEAVKKTITAVRKTVTAEVTAKKMIGKKETIPERITAKRKKTMMKMLLQIRRMNKTKPNTIVKMMRRKREVINKATKIKDKNQRVKKKMVKNLKMRKQVGEDFGHQSGKVTHLSRRD
ncbi:uncharacterized protein [Watersipora subatra]|uniref:uncharacterized protein n=1 Tax=Watersipora subatra TaxID=2589382 RepID=UPI00355BE2B0